MKQTTRPLAVLFLSSVAAALCAARPAPARTVEISCFDITGFAAISPEAPLQGWVGTGQVASPGRPGTFSSAAIDLQGQRSMLVRFDLSRVPADVRITKAELFVPIAYQPNPQVRFYVYRLLAEWGAGVCERFRSRRPKEESWAEPGARGPGTDRALNPTERVELKRVQQDVTINVTTDVELWHSGGATNQGWIFLVNEQGQWIRFTSPIAAGRERWRLRVTYEPKS